MNGREAAYAALFAKLQTVAGIVTFERRLRHWNDVLPAEMPYLALAQTNQIATPVKGLPTKWTLGADVYLYVRAENQPPGPLFNALLDALDVAISPPPGQVTQTLSDTVSHCWIEGEVQTDEGTLGPLAVAIVPLRILTS